MNAGLFFSADYRDGRVRIGSQTYPAGHYCVRLLNQYYKDDTAARISVFTNQNWQLHGQLKAGYLNAGDFTKAGVEICNIFHVLPWLKPFDALDIKAERNRIENLFTNEKAEMLISYFRRRAAVGTMDEGQVLLHLLPPEYDKTFFEQSEGQVGTATVEVIFVGACFAMANQIDGHFSLCSNPQKIRLT